MSYKELYEKLSKMKKAYPSHKYQVYNDIYHWPIILSTTIRLTVAIRHMDLSENISQMHKYEPQSSHFNKSQYSLHCTVTHNIHEEKPTLIKK